jgi:pimeloyl-ACP methyl ester carboxylesterase
MNLFRIVRRVTAEGHACLKIRLLWEEWSPTWHFDDATYARTAPAFDSPDFVPIVIHSYRDRHGNAPSDPRFEPIEKHLANRPAITVPTIVLHGADDTVSPPQRSERDMAMFAAATERHVVPHAGHFMPREQPGAVVDALLKLGKQTQ